ncbi:MAG TPA: bacillithiol biosynthesis BshC [Acidobacteriota bacterium]|nr:bacillithiol biosynthesis BshC [Acidobacteriota bacterium]
MRLRSLPGYSALYLDYVEGNPSVRQFLPCRPDREALFSHVKQARSDLPRDELCGMMKIEAEALHAGGRVFENIHKLNDPGSVAVVTTLRPHLLGGPLSTLLRCLTAVKVAAELSENGHTAIPVAWIRPPDVQSHSELPLVFLDAESTLVRLAPDESELDPLAGLLQRILNINPAGWDAETVEELRDCCRRDASRGTASTAFLARVMGEWGLVILDFREGKLRIPGSEAIADISDSEVGSDMARRLAEAGYDAEEGVIIGENVIQSSVLPLAARIVGSSDLPAAAVARPVLQKTGHTPPLLWPRLNATVMDARMRKICERYNVSIEDLFAGRTEVMRKTGLKDLDEKGLARFDELMTTMESRIREAAALATEQQLRQEVTFSHEKISYQLGKLRERYVSASRLRRETAQRHLDRACNTLAPALRPQECELSALYFVLRYSHAILRLIYDKMDIWNHDHQVIDVD